MSSKFVNINDFIQACTNNNVRDLDVTIAYRVDPITGRVATFDWSFSRLINGDELLYMDDESCCWFDDGFPFCEEDSGALDFSYSCVRKGTQHERVSAYVRNLAMLSLNGIEITNVRSYNTAAMLRWLDMVVSCLSDDGMLKKHLEIFKDIDRVADRYSHQTEK